jgi:hypothetical protein
MREDEGAAAAEAAEFVANRPRAGGDVGSGLEEPESVR